MSSELPHDTPVDTPASSIIEAPALAPELVVAGERALERARTVETLEPAYAAWNELRAAHREARRRWKEERQRLLDQGSLLLGATRAALGASPGSEALAAPNEFLREAQLKLEAALAEIDASSASGEASFAGQLDSMKALLFERVARLATSQRPVFNLAVRVLAGGQRILHLRRLGEDESVLALHALTGRIPSRYEYLFDDSTDDVSAAPPTLYADEGVTDVRGDASLDSRPQVWPVKGVLPLKLPSGQWVRWSARGAVLEAEALDGAQWRNLLSAGEAEALTGFLLARQLAGRLVLQLVRD
ncbi:MAG: hypothetical protein DI536_21200 [Archangium gephyra]|uniref:Uncharacterized protein n=1 Tax=Archangium gephyra TaxID=48 RepID=A0A2W5V2C6_9BACT|nr:MAG: hypothetical protein DI536_21200 [Archangium gephyra]